MKLPLFFGAYCLMILLGYSVGNYRGWTILGNTSQAASTTGGARAGGSSGFHK